MSTFYNPLHLLFMWRYVQPPEETDTSSERQKVDKLVSMFVVARVTRSGRDP